MAMTAMIKAGARPRALRGAKSTSWGQEHREGGNSMHQPSSWQQEVPFGIPVCAGWWQGVSAGESGPRRYRPSPAGAKGSLGQDWPVPICSVRAP